MRDFRPVFFIMGILLCIESMTMLIPMIIDLIFQNNDWQIFLLSSILTFFIGLVLYFSFKKQKNKINLRQAFVLTVLSWITIAIFASLPFIFSSANLDFTDAFFESISGITTTGATVINKLDDLPHGILIWRSFLQWFGGIGIIVLAIAILPTLQIGGMQILHMEHDDPYEKTLPKVGQFVFNICLIYLFLTIVCAVLYFLAGMTSFDAICHAMTTIATGGFSTHNNSFGSFKSANIEWISIIFMIIGSLPFVVYLKITHRDWRIFYKDDQIKLFFKLIIVIVAITTIWLSFHSSENIYTIIRVATFNVTSILTGTGYNSSDFSQWGGFGLVIMFLIMYFIIIRPQKKQQKQFDEMISNLKKGDRVLTRGGIYCVIVDFIGADKQKLLVDAGNNTKFQISKSYIATYIDKETNKKPENKEIKKGK